VPDRRFNLTQKTAVEVTGCETAGPAFAAGVDDGDLLVALAGREVTSVEDLQRLMTELPVNEPVIATLLRGAVRLEREVTPSEYPTPVH
jgi:S1-C subfamily serine protease